jgi:hypothetical protein
MMDVNDLSVVCATADGVAAIETCYPVKRAGHVGVPVKCADGTDAMIRAFHVFRDQRFIPKTPNSVWGTFNDTGKAIFRLSPQPSVYYVIDKEIVFYKSGFDILNAPAGEYRMSYELEPDGLPPSGLRAEINETTFLYFSYGLTISNSDNLRVYTNEYSNRFGVKGVRVIPGYGTFLSGADATIDVRAYCQEDIDDYGLDPYAGMPHD